LELTLEAVVAAAAALMAATTEAVLEE